MQVLTGYLGESASFCSAWVEGATVKVRFFTDASVVSRGFRVYRVESKREHPVEARFPGQWLERETVVKDATTQTTVYAGLHNNWHRFYDPETARYITPDPLGLMAGMNPFAYVDGAPVTFVDLEGTHPVLANLLRRFGPPLLNVLKTFGKRAHRWTKGLTKGKVTNNTNVPGTCDKAKAAVSRYNHNDLHHLFGRGGDAPTKLLEKYGSVPNALAELQKAAQMLVNQNYVSGTWVTVKVGDMPVSITGKIVEGIFRISSIAKKDF